MAFVNTDLYLQLLLTSGRGQEGACVRALCMMQCTRLQLQLWIG